MKKTVFITYNEYLGLKSIHPKCYRIPTSPDLLPNKIYLSQGSQKAGGIKDGKFTFIMNESVILHKGDTVVCVEHNGLFDRDYYLVKGLF